MMKTFLKTLFGLLILIIGIALVLPIFYVLPGTTYRGIDVSGRRSDLSDKICSIALDDTLTLISYDNYKVSIPLKDIATCTCSEDSIKLNYFDWYLQRELKPVTSITLSADKLKDFLQDKWVDCTNAYIYFDGYKFNLYREKYGFTPKNVDRFVEYVVSNFDTIIDVCSLCKEPSVTVSDLEDDFAEVNWLNDFCIEYDSGLSFDVTYLKDYLPEQGDCTKFVKSLDDTFLQDVDTDKFIDKLVKEYETTGKDTEFTTTSGEVITVPYNTFGVKLNKKVEKEFIQECLNLRRSSTKRKPELIGYDNLKDTYIEISIEEQHVWYYKNGELKMDSPCVTGQYNRHDTPKGLFYISERIPGKYLVGIGYRTWVNRWMRLNNNGIGLHDASWRASFGKEIYKYNGSHGCINLPKQWSYELYKETYIGMPVVIY